MSSEDEDRRTVHRDEQRPVLAQLQTPAGHRSLVRRLVRPTVGLVVAVAAMAIVVSVPALLVVLVPLAVYRVRHQRGRRQ